jgi:formiminotetrahydrofolate cyclodeaminase
LKDLLALSAEQLLAEFAAGTAAPAAGSAAALTGALAAGLVAMVATLTVEKATAGTEQLRMRYGQYGPRASELAAEAKALRRELQAAVQADAEIIEAWVNHRKREAAPSSGQVQVDAEAQAILRRAAAEPLRIARAVLRVVECAGELSVYGYRSARGDVEVAHKLALAAADAALGIATANFADPRLDPEWVRQAGDERAVLFARLSRFPVRSAAGSELPAE